MQNVTKPHGTSFTLSHHRKTYILRKHAKTQNIGEIQYIQITLHFRISNYHHTTLLDMTCLIDNTVNLHQQKMYET